MNGSEFPMMNYFITTSTFVKFPIDASIVINYVGKPKLKQHVLTYLCRTCVS